MHIEYVQGKNFGIVIDLRFDYVDGTIVVRGGNGSGKTTFTAQLPLYLMFGSSTLDAPLADTVNENGGKLGGEMKYGPYIVKRSKASASVTGPGVKISGQEEVSAFFYNLFGMAKGTEEAVLLAKQGKTAGILEEGPAKATAIIEELAGFDHIDQLIDRVKLKYPTGAKAVLEDNLQNYLDVKLALEQEVLPVLPELEKVLKDAEFLANSYKEPIEVAQKAVDDTEVELKEAIANNNRITLAKASLKTNVDKLAEDTASLVDLEAAEYKQFDMAELGKARALIENVAEATSDRAAYEWVISLKAQEDVWPGDLNSFTTELENVAADVASAKQRWSDTATAILRKSSEKEVEAICSKCGSDITAKMEEINNKIEEELKALYAGRSKLVEALAEDEPYLKQLRGIEAVHKDWLKEVPSHPSIKVNRDVVPFSYSWNAEVPVKPEQEAINAAAALIKEFDLEATKLKLNDKLIATTKANITLTELKISAGEQDLAAHGTAVATEGLEAQVASMKNLVDELKAKEVKAVAIAADAKTKLEVAKEKVIINTGLRAAALNDIQRTKEKIKVDGRNGKIIKSVRDAKPKVLDLVWTNILKAVSQTHSEMMGRPMEIVKEAKGFRINGRHVARLSGAESSTLGIALRGAIRDVFASSCNFMFLDEPFSDMEPMVKYNAQAAVAALRGQRFVITHEDESELMADQVIEMKR